MKGDSHVYDYRYELPIS